MTRGDDATPLPRDQFPVTAEHCYLDHPGTGVLPLVAVEAMAVAAIEFAEGGSEAFPTWDDRQEEVRDAGARLLGVPLEDVAFIKNTTEGLGFVANGLEWQAGDRVVVPDFEFPSTVYPFLSLRDRGVTVDLIEPVGETRALPLELFEEALAEAPTRLVAVSWAQFGRAWRTDLSALADLCHAQGTLLCADIIQGLGVMPAELAEWGVDFAMADAHKWMLGPLGIGLLYVAHDHHQLLRPLEPGWASVAHREEWDNLTLDYDDTARRFEGGTTNLITIAGMGASIDLLLETGVDRIWAHVDTLTDRLAAGLTEVGATVVSDRSPAGRSAFLTFTVDGVDPTATAEALREDGFICSDRGGGLRAGPHGYNTADEIDAFVTAIDALT
jgi:cysteine desulfurase/selenocysteine lyase